MANKWTVEQEAAMRDYHKTLLVSAAAGSGKTSVLTERIIRSLTDREHPADLSRMLIVTFTRASAADLKAKIAKALTAALAERPGDAHLTKQLLGLGSAQISTIDSFFQKAVRANFDALDLPAAFRIADTAEALPICMRALNDLLEDHYAKGAQEQNSKDDPLARIRDNAFAEAMDHLMSGRSDGKLEALLLTFYDKFSSYPQGIGLLHECAQALTREAEGECFESRAGEVLKAHLLEQFRSFDTFLIQTLRQAESDPDLYKKCSGILNSDIDFCNAMLHALEDGSYARAREVVYTFVTGRFPTIKGEQTPDYLLRYKAWRGKFKDIVTKKVQFYLQWPAEALPAQFYKTAALCEALYGFYSDYEAAVLKEKKTRGILEYNDIRAALYRLLTRPDGSPSPAAMAMASQYDAVYIDEYQDVDFLQDRIFARIGGSRRFMVGDIKQSIYVFRGSEPSVFADYRRRFPLYTEDGDDNAEGVCVFMSNNFRCDDPVIRFTNKVCAFLFSACEQSIGYREQDDLVFTKSKNTDTEPVHVAVFDAKPRGKKQDVDESDEPDEEISAEDVWVAREIARLIREETLDDGKPITPADIAILVRAKSHGVGIARALERLHIPVVAEAASNLMEEPLMIDVLNLLRTVDNPYRDLPLSEYLLSPLGGFSLEELTAIRAATPDCKALFDAMTAKAEEKERTPLGAKTFAFCSWIDTLRESAATLPADRFLRLLYLDERLIPYQGDSVLLYLYEQARVSQRAAFCGLYAFLDTMTKLQSSEKVSADGFRKPEKAVSIMTVHHSKGLEYPVVFLCASGKGFNKDDLKKSLLFHRSVGCASKLYNEELGETEDCILHTAAKLAIDAEQTEESIRTLYVALTRARERLYVTGTLPGNRDSALTSAELVTRGDRTAILGCNSYLAWILAALREKGGTDAPYTLNFYSHVPDPLPEDGSAEAEETGVCTDQPASEISDEISMRYASVLQNQASFAYPLDFLRGLPTKAAASKLAPDLLDRLEDADEEEITETQLDLMRSKQPTFDELLLASQKPTAADIGTATHTFLQFCNFERLSKDGLDAECARLLAGGFLSRAHAEIFDRAQLEAFRQSDLMKEILAAKQVFREQKFNLFVPFDELTVKKEHPTALGEHSLFVQGSIDLLLETVDGELLLVDYKTDRMTSAERKNPALFRARLRDTHKNQLSYYQKAVEQLFSKAPDHTYLYSLPLGELVEIR